MSRRDVRQSRSLFPSDTTDGTVIISDLEERVRKLSTLEAHLLEKEKRAIRLEIEAVRKAENVALLEGRIRYLQQRIGAREGD